MYLIKLFLLSYRKTLLPFPFDDIDPLIERLLVLEDVDIGRLCQNGNLITDIILRVPMLKALSLTAVKKNLRCL